MPVHHRVTWFIYYEVTRSITTPPLDGMLVHHRVTWFIYYEVTRSITTPHLDGMLSPSSQHYVWFS